MTRLSKKTKATIKDLAVAYGSVCQALHAAEGEDRDIALSVWGDMLLNRQNDLGIEMVDAITLKQVFMNARDRNSQRRLAKALAIETHDRAEYELEQRT